MSEAKTRKKSLHEGTNVSKSEVSVPKQEYQKYMKVRQDYENAMFKNDTIRKKYDLRFKDPKSINNIWLRLNIQQLSKRTIEDNKILKELNKELITKKKEERKK